MKQTVKLYICKNLDYKGFDWEEDVSISCYDTSTSDHRNHILIGTTEVEVEIPSVDINEKAIAKFDAMINNVRAEMTAKITAIEAKKQEFLAIECDNE